uniref:Uncharacterized protein, isoform A n=1 Tax=Drosophila pseudoobscura pseudoobscura TaxID=46245 RepID=A0A0R3NXV4_DROPS
MDLVPENSSSANKRTTAGGRVKWSAALECLLVDIWQEKIEDLRGPRKNSHVYMYITHTVWSYTEKPANCSVLRGRAQSV